MEKELQEKIFSVELSAFFNEKTDSFRHGLTFLHNLNLDDGYALSDCAQIVADIFLKAFANGETVEAEEFKKLYSILFEAVQIVEGDFFKKNESDEKKAEVCAIKDSFPPVVRFSEKEN